MECYAIVFLHVFGREENIFINWDVNILLTEMSWFTFSVSFLQFNENIFLFLGILWTEFQVLENLLLSA